jgi:hypothetical protein
MSADEEHLLGSLGVVSSYSDNDQQSSGSIAKQYFVYLFCRLLGH